MTSATQTSCIQHPAQNHFSILRQDYWQICATNELSQTARACAAKLLNVFEQWMNSRLSSRTQARRSNSIAMKHGEEPQQDESLWVYETADSLAVALIGEHPAKTIRQALNWLASIGYLRRRRNPKYQWDRTYQYQIDVQVVQAAIAKTLEFTQVPHREHHDSPEGISSLPTGQSNTIDSFIDSNSNTSNALARANAATAASINACQGQGSARELSIEKPLEEQPQQPTADSDTPPVNPTDSTDSPKDSNNDRRRPNVPPPAPPPKVEAEPTFEVDKQGWLRLPTAGRFKLPATLAIGRMQRLLALTLDETAKLMEHEDGEVACYGDEPIVHLYKEATAQPERKAFEQGVVSLKALLNYARSLDDLPQDWLNKALQYLFLDSIDWCEQQGRRALSSLQTSWIDLFFEGDRAALGLGNRPVFRSLLVREVFDSANPDPDFFGLSN